MYQTDKSVVLPNHLTKTFFRNSSIVLTCLEKDLLLDLVLKGSSNKLAMVSQANEKHCGTSKNVLWNKEKI